MRRLLRVALLTFVAHTTATRSNKHKNPGAAVAFDGATHDVQPGELGDNLERELGPLPILADDQDDLLLAKSADPIRISRSSSVKNSSIYGAHSKLPKQTSP